MSSKTFKSATGVDSELDVRANDCGVFIALSRGGQIRQASTFAASDAPALALAVLEAAYDRDHTVPHKIREAWTSLYVHVIEEERANAEAREQAELEAEALELHNAFWVGVERNQLDRWADEQGNSKNSWVSAARRAREMRNEKKEPTND